MEERELFRIIVEKLEQANISYMLTGSFAVTFYGTPRTTHDIDFVLALTKNDAQEIYKIFQEDFYISDIEHAVLNHQMFNIIYQPTQMRTDCWILDERDEYRREAFERKKTITMLGRKVNIISAEDLIISKLLWNKDIQSEKHINDILGILSIQDNVETEYIERWCEKLSLMNDWLQAKNKLIK